MNKPLRVLIVEDSEDDTELLVYQLERSGYDVIYQRVDNASVMLTALQQQQWDIVLADYAMPQFNATEALKLLQETGLDLPFIIVSGNIGDGIAVAAMKAGAHDYLLKDNLARLVPAVQRELQEAANRKSLQESEDRWQLALRGSNDGIWDWNIKTNTVFFSQRWKQMLGYEDQEIGNHFEEWLQLIHPEDLPLVTQAIQDHLAKKTEFYSTEHRLKCRDGSYKWVLSRGQALWNETENPVRVVGSHTDISDRKQMEAALRQQAEDLAEANRLKDEFLAVISHELRTPLNAILGWAQILRSRQVKPETAASAIETIERNAKLQQQLVQDLLDVSRIIQGKMRLMVTNVNLAAIIKAAVDTVQAAADAKGIQIKCSIDSTVESISGDPDRLQQVLWNLLTNAIKFTPEGGQVEVRLTFSPELNSSHSALIEVSDTGIGIKPEFLPHVFERFRQADSSTTRSYGGLGLGLAIVRHLVELHGGTVNAYSDGEGKGTTFTVKLPLLKLKGGETGTEGEVESKLSSSYLSLQDLHILIVDDDTDTRQFLLSALNEYGADVKAAASAHEALVALTKFTPDVVVSDIGMPEQDGYALIRQVRNLESLRGRGNVPVVALTAYASEQDRAKVRQAGFATHLSKPIEIPELVAVVAELAGRANNHGL